MENVFIDFYSQPSHLSQQYHPTRGQGCGIMGKIIRFAIPLLKAVVPVLVGTVSDYLTKDVSLTQAFTDNVRQV